MFYVWLIHEAENAFNQQFSTGILQEFLKHAVPDYLVRSADLFPLRLSNKNDDNNHIIIAIWCERIKIIPIFGQIGKNIFFGVLQNFSN